MARIGARWPLSFITVGVSVFGLLAWHHTGADCFASETASPIISIARPDSDRPNAVFGFVGPFTRGNMGDSLNIGGVEYDDTYIVALGYSRDLWHPGWGFVLGAEFGVGWRFGDGTSPEFWGGAVLRHVGVVFFDFLRVSLGATAGLSVVPNPIGTEQERETVRGGNASLLFYLSPEIALSVLRYTNLEIFYRLHHRSGGREVLGGMGEGSNANVIGVRYRF